MKKKKSFAPITMLAICALLIMPCCVDAGSYSFSLDRFQVTSNPSGGIVDEFDDGSIGSLWEIYEPTVVESGGTATFSNPGEVDSKQLDTLSISSEMSYIGSTFQMTDGAGDAQGTSTWAPIVPDTNQIYGMNIGGSQDIGINVYNFSPAVAAYFGVPQGLGIFFGRFGNVETGDFDVQGISIMSDDIVGEILLRLTFDDAANLVTGSVSLDGGLTFTSPFSSVSRSAAVSDSDVWSLGAESWEVQSDTEPSIPEISYSIDGLMLTLTWTSVADADGYLLSYAPSPYTGAESIGSSDLGNQTSFSCQLWEGAAFLIAVQAYNSEGFSNYSEIRTVTIPYFIGPVAPQLSYDLQGTSLTVSWSAVPKATGYLLKYTTSASAGQESFIPVDLGSQTSFSYAYLSEGETYRIAVQAYNDVGTSDFSNIETFTVPVAPSLGIAGTWMVTEYTGPNTCDDPVGEYSNYYGVVHESGALTFRGITVNGVISGNTVSSTSNVSFAEDGGITTVTSVSMTVSADGNNVEGSSEWYWSDYGYTCRGRQTLSGYRLD